MSISRPLSIEHDASRNRFIAVLDEQGQEAVVTYRQKDNQLGITHTGVPPQYRRRGIAGEMVQHVIDYARANDLRVVPYCSYVVHYLNEHPDQKDVLQNSS